MLRTIVAAVCAAMLLAGCTDTQLAKLQHASGNFQTAVTTINADIAAVAPNVAAACADLQKWAMLIAPFVPTSGKAQQYLGAANGALAGFCQAVPTDITGTAVAVASAVRQAQSGYNQVKVGG